MIRGELRIVFQWGIPENTPEEEEEGFREEAERRLTVYEDKMEKILDLLDIHYSTIEIEADFE